jgi:hypothetical protein
VQANQSDVGRAAASYQDLQPGPQRPELVPLWLALLSRRTATEAALDAAEQWPGTLAARHLIEGTVAMITGLSRPVASPSWQRRSAPRTLQGSRRGCLGPPGNQPAIRRGRSARGNPGHLAGGSNLAA